MKSFPIVPFAIVSLLFAACEQKSAQITSSTPKPPPTPAEAAEAPDFSGLSSTSTVEASQTAEANTSPSTSGTANPRPVFRSEEATEAANQYLDSYNRVLNDVTAVPGTRPAIPADPKAAVEAALVQARKAAQDSRALADQQKQVDRLLTPDEKKRLRQYQKSLQTGEQDTN